MTILKLPTSPSFFLPILFTTIITISSVSFAAHMHKHQKKTSLIHPLAYSYLFSKTQPYGHSRFTSTSPHRTTLTTTPHTCSLVPLRTQPHYHPFFATLKKIDKKLYPIYFATIALVTIGTPCGVILHTYQDYRQTPAQHDSLPPSPPSDHLSKYSSLRHFSRHN